MANRKQITVLMMEHDTPNSREAYSREPIVERQMTAQVSRINRGHKAVILTEFTIRVNNRSPLNYKPSTANKVFDVLAEPCTSSQAIWLLAWLSVSD